MKIHYKSTNNLVYSRNTLGYWPFSNISYALCNFFISQPAINTNFHSKQIGLYKTNVNPAQTCIGLVQTCITSGKTSISSSSVSTGRRLASTGLEPASTYRKLVSTKKTKN